MGIRDRQERVHQPKPALVLSPDNNPGTISPSQDYFFGREWPPYGNALWRNQFVFTENIPRGAGLSATDRRGIRWSQGGPVRNVPGRSRKITRRAHLNRSETLAEASVENGTAGQYQVLYRNGFEDHGLRSHAALNAAIANSRVASLPRSAVDCRKRAVIVQN
jgi:hypothetical protein